MIAAMADSLPLPAEAPSHPDPGALDPTEVIPRPQPVEAGEASEVRVISGEVVGGRHRGQRRGPGRSSVGTAVLTATGAVAGLSMLMPHGGSGNVAEAAQEPVSAVPDGVVEDTMVPTAAGAAVAAETPESGVAAVTKSASKGTGTGTPTNTGTGSGTRDTARTDTPDGPPAPGRHARVSGNWDSEDWQEAVARAVAAHRSGEQGHLGGRHRSGGGSGWNGGSGGDRWGGDRQGDWSRGD
ncbi:hypothetical protein SAMN05216252_10798 [Actinacidiphila glaucinigra]|uniref:Uncharacterized protein n=2 Tax=Actinacidiphila glaucinigra TaxID=235986 RepID=A0A239FXI6_9ACTN|nr:hypothetical protein SAMN05216252_10798 [Actinacidiphila glaucinigra]